MATGRGESQLRGRVPLALPVALTLLLFGAASRARSQYQPSGYLPLDGQPFFLLSDESFGPGELAQVRLEVATRDYGLSAIEEYGGVDMVVYRVPRPLSFLERQPNLHRVRVDALDREEGLANTLAHLWDRWYRASRIAWRRIFSAEARSAVTEQAPELRMPPQGATPFAHPPQFRPLPDFDLVERYRYPVHRAAQVKPPRGVELAGSSSEFISPSEGNVMVPLGRLDPGLYLVEAYVGAHRATTLVFVGDAVAITKTSAKDVLVWTAHRTTGIPIPGVKLAWSDGTGVLERGVTNAEGVARLVHETPERSYVFGTDPGGGVFISEGFYYDSEIYDAKLYAITDRPLYRPGDQVFVKLLGRAFQSARDSFPLTAGPVTLSAFDPNGVPVVTQRLQLDPGTGADTSFRLPESAVGGGYDLRLAYGNGTYAAAFRVAEYQKPHFEITLVPDQADFKTGQEIGGRLQLSYPDGKPVRDAEVQLTVRSQKLTMVEGELEYYGQFPVKLEAETLQTDARGHARFALPAAAEPSRYVITVFATDGAAYRVKTTRELLVERSTSAFSLHAARPFSAPGEKVTFDVQPVGTPGEPPASWEWVRLEDQKRANGPLKGPSRLEIAFAESGSYTVQLRDARGNVVAGVPHWVSGGGVRPPAGSIEIVPSQDTCVPGETVEMLITFPEPVEEALLTLERDRVEETALLHNAKGWITAKRLAPTQWRARVPVRPDFAPNVTVSVAYVRNGDYVFQNQGLKVARPRVELALVPDKQRYAPGETVTVDVVAKAAGKPVSTLLTVAVVDEMIFALQPEIAPNIYDFFYHPRRNNVRTSSSLSFIAYDLAASRSLSAPATQGVNERRVKVLERPRREDVDTACWQPALRTDAKGRARFSFVMPDSLTRWRITARALTADGTVGQRTANVFSEKALYAKWTSPRWMRVGDAPTSTIAVFNQTTAAREADLTVSAPGIESTQRLTLKPGVSFVSQPMRGIKADGAVRVTLREKGAVVDSLETPFSRIPARWTNPQTLVVDLQGAATPLALPADAVDLRVRFAASAPAHFSRVIDDLLEYPYGCIEQTSSRMIPFALAIEALGPEATPLADRLRQQLNGQRLRLAYLASPRSWFTWWGASETEDPFLTAYAYYADWRAVRALAILGESDHWNRLLDVYSESASTLPLFHRALMLHWMAEMKLPVKGLVDGLQAQLAAEPLESVPRRRLSRFDSRVLVDPDDRLGHAFAITLVDSLARRLGVARSETLAKQTDAAYAALVASGTPAAEALLIASGRLPAAEAARVLRSVTAEMPTIERALTLTWLDGALRRDGAGKDETPTLDAPWRAIETRGGSVQWLWAAGQPLPAELKLATPPAHATAAVVQFDSASSPGASLGAQLERHLYRVTKSGEGHELTPLDPGTPLQTDELYLDEIRVVPKGGSVRHAVVEVPLPPGASVESTTWGINLPNDSGDLQGLERARHEPTPHGYALPIQDASSGVTLRHLVRFAQRGSFVVPPARVYRMYQPEAKTLEEGARDRWEIR